MGCKCWKCHSELLVTMHACIWPSCIMDMNLVRLYAHEPAAAVPCKVPAWFHHGTCTSRAACTTCCYSSLGIGQNRHLMISIAVCTKFVNDVRRTQWLEQQQRMHEEQAKVRHAADSMVITNLQHDLHIAACTAQRNSSTTAGACGLHLNDRLRSEVVSQQRRTCRHNQP